MPIKFYFLLVWIVFSFGIQAQEFEIKGNIISETQEDAFVNIINLSQQSGSISNANGEFTITVQLNDTLLFSAVQFEKVELIVTPEVIAQPSVEIYLVEKNNLLQEVVINPYGLTGNLEKDANNMPSYTFDYKAAGMLPPKKPRTQSERRLYTATSASVDYLLNTINGRIKKLRKLNEWSKLDELKADIQQKIPEDYFTSNLEIPEKYIEDFIYFCVEEKALQSFIQNNQDLEIFHYLKLKAHAYLLLKTNETRTP